LISALKLVVRRSVRGLTRVLPVAATVFGCGLIAFGFSRALWLSMVLMLVAGYGMLQGLTVTNTVIQTLVDEKMRGRVMSYYTAAFVGMAPFGSLLAGALAHWIGAPLTVMINGSVCILGAVWFWTQLPAIRKEMRPIYERLGIIPPPPEVVVESAGRQ
jgi:MFS family permease